MPPIRLALLTLLMAATPAPADEQPGGLRRKAFFVAEKVAPEAIAARSPALAEAVGESINEGKYLYGRHIDFFRQLAARNLPAAWQGFDGHALAIYGAADFVTGAEDHDLIARIVNDDREGHGTFLKLDGIDHGFSRAAAPADSFGRAGAPGEFNPAIIAALRDWMDRLVKAGEPKP